MTLFNIVCIAGSAFFAIAAIVLVVQNRIANKKEKEEAEKNTQEWERSINLQNFSVSDNPFPIRYEDETFDLTQIDESTSIDPNASPVAINTSDISFKTEEEAPVVKTTEAEVTKPVKKARKKSPPKPRKKKSVQ